MQDPRFVPLVFEEMHPAEMHRRASDFVSTLARRRTVREFSGRPVPRELIEDCLRAAGSAPSGANRQPWRFVAVSDPDVKRRIREAAEEEERAFYDRRAPEAWLEALAPLGTGPHKPYLESAPWLIAIFAEKHAIGEQGEPKVNYYVAESVGIATGFLIAAVHIAGLTSLTHTPSPMGFLNTILQRPPNERPFLLLVVGYPAEGALVPDIQRKPLEEIAQFV